MRIFKTKAFDKFAQKNHIDDGELFEAVMRAEQGLIDADLGGNIIKQRIAREGQGRSGGFRSFIGSMKIAILSPQSVKMREIISQRKNWRH